MTKTKYKQCYIFFFLIGHYFISLYCSAVEIVIPSVSVNTDECFAINVELYKIEDIEIGTAVIAFAFDPMKIQIGCSNTPELGTNYNEPVVYDSDTSPEESPIILSQSFLEIGVKYRLAIYPQGVMIVVLWNAKDKFPQGLLFTVPCKLTEKAIPGDKLVIPLIPKEEPIYIRRTFSDNQVESQSFYCSLADKNALPIDASLVYGTIYVKSTAEGEFLEGEGYQEEGIFEGINPEGTEEGSIPEGNIEGVEEGNASEGNITEGISEGETTEGETHYICRCGGNKEISTQERLSISQKLKINNLNIGFMIALVVILRRL